MLRFCAPKAAEFLKTWLLPAPQKPIENSPNRLGQKSREAVTEEVESVLIDLNLVVIVLIVSQSGRNIFIFF